MPGNDKHTCIQSWSAPLRSRGEAGSAQVMLRSSISIPSTAPFSPSRSNPGRIPPLGLGSLQAAAASTHVMPGSAFPATSYTPCPVSGLSCPSLQDHQIAALAGDWVFFNHVSNARHLDFLFFFNTHNQREGEMCPGF